MCHFELPQISFDIFTLLRFPSLHTIPHSQFFFRKPHQFEFLETKRDLETLFTHRTFHSPHILFTLQKPLNPSLFTHYTLKFFTLICKPVSSLFTLLAKPFTLTTNTLTLHSFCKTHTLMQTLSLRKT